VPVDVDVIVDDPVVPVAKIINKIPNAHVVFSPISPFTLTLIHPLSIPCFFFYLAHPLPYSSTVSRLPVRKIIKKKLPQHTCTDPHTVGQSALRKSNSSRCLTAPKMYRIGLVDLIHLLVAVSGVVVPVDDDVVVDDPVMPVAKIINKIPTAHVVFSPISTFTLTLIPPLSIPCFFFYLAHPPFPTLLLFPVCQCLK